MDTDDDPEILQTGCHINDLHNSCFGCRRAHVQWDQPYDSCCFCSQHRPIYCTIAAANNNNNVGLLCLILFRSSAWRLKVKLIWLMTIHIPLLDVAPIAQHQQQQKLF